VSIGDIIDITAYGHYHWISCASILSIGNNFIIYEEDIYDPRNILTEESDASYILSIPTKPDAGVISYSSCASASGGNTIAAG
jgi:hypothetical protein